ncbi:conserved hypothetical protein [Frankia canadensis]|uniref:Uncharacterized protein n=1 Tax=Frankia canadensis TaxID=1836972 RepID=A0A2I2KLX9_9ACTN|nr:hypothetical protein [Frankia canadensis]SNQ46659.1 conserved hypothetical protein [Frankia canadensis]SOU53949.1 conserved hypothetical protein [Frankia canadensis]
MRRRRNDYRTWEELSLQERRRGLAVLAIVGAGAVTAVYLVVGGGGAQAEAAGAPAPPTVDTGAQLGAWYAGTAELRTQIVTAVNAVRADIQASDGTALRPACVQLGQIVEGIAGLGQPPTATASRTWTAGATAYSQAVTACGNLFDGTQLPPPVLLARTTEALNTADGQWTTLAAQIGAPAQIVPAS